MSLGLCGSNLSERDISSNLQKTVNMKNLFVLLAVTSLFFCACNSQTKEDADSTSKDSVGSKSTSDTAMHGTDTSAAQHNPAEPAATNAQY